MASTKRITPKVAKQDEISHPINVINGKHIEANTMPKMAQKINFITFFTVILF